MRNSNHSAIFTNKPAPEKACSSDELSLSGPFSNRLLLPLIWWIVWHQNYVAKL